MDNFNEKYERKNPFTVPDGYFEGLTDRIADRVNEEQKPKKTRFIQIVKPYMGLAAIFLLALLIVQVVLPGVVDKRQLLNKNVEVVSTPTQETTIEDIFDSQFNPTSEEIIEYLASEVDNYDFLYAGIY